MNQVLGRAFLLTSIIAIVMTASPGAPLAQGAGNPSKAARSMGSLTGQAFIKSDGGAVRYAAADTIWLVPDDIATRTFLKEMSTVGALYQPAVVGAIARSTSSRSTVGDSEGRFAFGRVRHGKYLVVTSISWQTGRYGVDRSGGVAWAEVVVPAGGRVTNVVATGRYKDSEE
jgi:hypothetical protein